MNYTVKSYINCTRCNLCQFRKNIVFGRGDLPAKVLFIGEAPGETEDFLGRPFVGPSGQILNAAIKIACSMAKIDKPPTYFITNTLGCRPTDKIKGKNREPLPDEIWRCTERVLQTHKDVSPKKVIFLGQVAKRAFQKVWPDATAVFHPAYILRTGGIGCPTFRALARDISKVFGEV